MKIKEMFADLQKDDITISEGFHHNLARTQDMIPRLKSQTQLDAYFDNFFNEPVHSKFGAGLNVVKGVISYILGFETDVNGQDQSVKDAAGSAKNEIDTVLKTLKFIKFLRD